MHNMMKKLPKIAIRVTRQRTAKMNHFSMLSFTFSPSSFFPSKSENEVASDVSLVVEDATSISLEYPRRNEDLCGRAFWRGVRGEKNGRLPSPLVLWAFTTLSNFVGDGSQCGNFKIFVSLRFYVK